jgi:hypothetical protein
MSEIQKITIIDATKSEVIEREMNAEELDNLKIVTAESKKRQDDLDANLAARQSALAKLAALGLTEAEIAAL